MNKADSNKELAGIIGGIGPEATSYFTSLLVKLHLPYVTADQEHIPFLLFNNPQIPDRTAYLLNKDSTNPLPEIIKTGIALKKAGATFLVMPCNTAHAFADIVATEVGLPLINMLDITAEYVQCEYGNNTTVGVLATTGTIYTQLFQQSFKMVAKNVSVLVPEIDQQEEVMKAIYSIKRDSVTDSNTAILQNAANNLKKRGASAIILGCTEIPLALKKEKCDFSRVDPMEILAQKVIERTIRLTSRKGAAKYYLQANVAF